MDYSQFSLLDDPEFQRARGLGRDGYNGVQQSSMLDTEKSSEEPMFSKDTARAAAYGAQSGGLSGALTAGGVTSLLTNGAAAGGPYAIAGGLILSQLEARQKAKAEAEAAAVQAENDRRSNMKSMYEKMASQSFGI